jgi:excisionase family DNA binding protein
MALVLRKIRSGFQGEAVVCTEEEMVDAVDVLWLVLHHPDKNVEVRDSQATSRAEFEILFQELLETYKATEKQKPRRRSGKAKPTTLDQLQAALLLSVSPRVVSNLVRRREIPFLKISRKCLRFRRNEIERWAEKHETKPI